MIETPLDRAHAAMAAAPDDDTLRLRFFERLGDTALFLLLESEAEGDFVTPRTFETQGETLVLVFDREERMAAFVGAEAPYVGLSGRLLMEMLAKDGLGLALNPETAPSSFVLGAEGAAWLANMLAEMPQARSEEIEALTTPGKLPAQLLEALDQKLAAALGLAQAAYLVGTEQGAGVRGHMLGIVGPLEGAQEALAQAMGEAVRFSGLEAGVLDVAFFAASDPVVARLARVGLRFDIPQPDRALEAGAPGMDADRPPILK